MKFYLTAAIPYVNAAPHIGHALEFVQGDVIARVHRQRGDEVFYLTGTDENSLKVLQASEKEGIPTSQFADQYSAKFKDFLKLYNISFDAFMRTTAPEHVASVQELWRRCETNGDIYKKQYSGLYCVGCEVFYAPEELNEKGECNLHPGKPLEKVTEENYFFRLSKYQEQLQKLIDSDEYKVVPEHRKNEALGFIRGSARRYSSPRCPACSAGEPRHDEKIEDKSSALRSNEGLSPEQSATRREQSKIPDRVVAPPRSTESTPSSSASSAQGFLTCSRCGDSFLPNPLGGLQDFSISRSTKRSRGWGVPVPGDSEQIMYVWFDALNVYRSGAPEHWPAKLHIVGKDIMRFHAIYWPAMLISAKLPLPKELFVHGFVTVNGQKMSKTIGNTVDPIELVQKYGLDAVRYYLLREIPSTDDGDFSEEKFKLRFNADLANGLGNFASRVLTLAEKLNPWNLSETSASLDVAHAIAEIKKDVAQAIDERRLHDALAHIWRLVSFGDKMVNATKPWELKDEDPKKREILGQLLLLLNEITILITPFLPETAKTLEQSIVKSDGVITSVSKPAKALFARL